jgi:hypothetical protein
MVIDKHHRKNTRVQGVKLPVHGAGLPAHASGEQNVSKGSFVHIVPLDPAYKVGLAGHVPVGWSRVLVKVGSSLEPSSP